MNPNPYQSPLPMKKAVASSPSTTLMRIAAGTSIGVAIGLAFCFTMWLVEGIHPLDLWWAIKVHCSLGGSVGFAAGIVWGVAHLLANRNGRK